MNEQEGLTPNRRIMLNTLAVIGFIALIGTSMWLAAYSTRFVPDIVSRIGSAAVYLGSVFTPAPESGLAVVETPTATSTISSTASSTVSTTTRPATPKPSKPVAGAETSSTYQIGGASPTTPSVPGGLPDFVVIIDAVGYLATSSAESFIASSTVPTQSRPAVKFTVTNVGNSTSGTWRFSASIPTQTAYIFESQPQQPLAPGDSIAYTLGFDQANKGAGQTISITANFDRAVAESNSNNNSASARLTIIGS